MDLLDALRERPQEFDIRTSQQMMFVGGKSVNEPVSAVFYDDTSYFEVYTGNDVKDLVENRKMAGVVVPVGRLRELLMMLLDSWAVLMNNAANLEDRLRVANKISDLLETMKLL